MSNDFEPKREFTYTFKIWCASDGIADTEQVEQLIDLNMQELVFDENFSSALDERQAITIQVIPSFGKVDIQNG
jgi:archaellin